MSARIFVFPTFDRGWSDAAQADEPHVVTPANDTREQADAEHAAAIRFATLLIVGTLCFGAGCLFTAGMAYVVSWFL